MPKENRFNFTVSALEKLAAPKTGRVIYRDEKMPALSLYVTSTGVISFFVRKRIGGRDERLIIGRFPIVTIEHARKKALIYSGTIADGKDPIEEKRKERVNRITFGDHFDEYLNRYSKVHKKSWIYDQREVNKYLSHWFNRKLSDIRRDEVQKLHEKIGKENGIYQANRILERVRGIINKAIEWGWEGTNPAAAIKKFKEKSRDRFVQPHEMPCLMHSLEIEENETFKCLFWMLLLVGARKTNTMMMKWEEIDWHLREWRIPDTKNGEPLRLPLVARAMDILKARHQTSNSIWVFPQDEDRHKHVVNLKRGWNRILERATLFLWLNSENIAEWTRSAFRSTAHLSGNEQIEAIQKMAEKGKIILPKTLLDIRIHDIRRTFGSYQALSGASLQIIGKSLGHKSQQATQIYARLNLDPVRDSVEKAVDAMFSF